MTDTRKMPPTPDRVRGTLVVALQLQPEVEPQPSQT